MSFYLWKYCNVLEKETLDILSFKCEIQLLRLKNDRMTYYCVIFKHGKFFTSFFLRNLTKCKDICTSYIESYVFTIHILDDQTTFEEACLMKRQLTLSENSIWNQIFTS